ncbi:MAG TPA: hypothetical protein VNS32_20020, partial [Flavisolibacter sp.]|nr:hypothetical protein [Flavisolibacter sp.]
RNVYTQNGGRVDSKYLNEVHSSTFKEGEIAKLDLQYITDTTRICVGMATLTTKLVIENVYKEKFTGHNPAKILKDLSTFYEH